MKDLKQFIKETIRGHLNETKYFSNEVKTLKKELTDQFTDYAKLDEKINDYEYTTVSKIKKENINISLNLALTDDRDDNTYPIDYGEIILYLSKISLEQTLYCDIYITISDDYKNNTFGDLKRNVQFDGVLIHELHHIISNKHLYFPNKRIDTNKRHVFLKLTKEESEKEFRGLLYYLSKDELNSIIPQVNMGSYQYVKDLFNKYNNMPYSEFEKIFNENSNTKLNNKTYNKIMDRIKYFINKTKK